MLSQTPWQSRAIPNPTPIAATDAELFGISSQSIQRAPSAAKTLPPATVFSGPVVSGKSLTRKLSDNRRGFTAAVVSRKEGYDR